MNEERIDTYLDGSYFASTNSIYAQAYITYTSPKEFLNLTAGGLPGTAKMLGEESTGYGKLDTSKID